jgi:hypothetical protein
VNEEVLLEEGFHPEWEEPDEDDAEYWEDEP